MLSPAPVLLATLLVSSPSLASLASTRAEDVVAATCDPVLAGVLRDVLASSPALAAATLRASAAASRVAGVGLLPDPMVQVRTTTDRGGGASWDDSTDIEIMGTQSLPARSRRRAMIGQAQSMASSEEAMTEGARLDAVEEASRWYFEIARLDALDPLRRDELATLRAFAEAARGRYASGAGRQQDPLRAQAEVTRAELVLVEIAARRQEAQAALDELRGRETGEPLQPSRLPPPDQLLASFDGVRERALERAPAIEAADSDLSAARAGEDVARSANLPEISLGGFYEIMDAGGGMKMEDADQFGVVVGVSLPIRRRRIAAEVDEAIALRLAAVEQQRAARSVLTRRTRDALTRAEEARQSFELHEQVLGRQAEESLRSALSGYSTGLTTSLDVLDALRVEYEVRATALRARADFAMAEATLRTLVGGALPGASPCEASKPAVVELKPKPGPPAPARETETTPDDVPHSRRARLPRW